MIGSSRHHHSFGPDATAMQIDWGKTIDDILASNISCLRCGRMDPYACVGYSRSATAAEYAPRCQSCSRKEGCEARKLVVLCESCAKELRIRASPADQQAMMVLLMNDCRKDLEDCLDYLADYWQEDLDIAPEQAAGSLEGVAPTYLPKKTPGGANSRRSTFPIIAGSGSTGCAFPTLAGAPSTQKRSLPWAIPPCWETSLPAASLEPITLSTPPDRPAIANSRLLGVSCRIPCLRPVR